MSAGAAPDRFTDPDAMADAIVARVGKTIVLGLPLGLGKAPHVANALFARAAADPSIRLRIFTALTLERPALGSELERRFLGPILDREMGGYPEFAYARAQLEGALPPNIEVDEFFFQAGTRLDVASAQRSYISANYTHALRYLIDRGVNVVAQIVARQGARYSLSCNTDITLDLLSERAAGRADFLLVGQVNGALPFMPGPAVRDERDFAMLLDSPETDFPLFGSPRQPVSTAQHAIGLHVASLVPDGGSLQIGIGAIGDAVANALILRHRDPDRFTTALDAISVGEAGPERHRAPFVQGLYAPTEMLSDCFLDLMRAGILSRAVDGAVAHAGFFLGPRSFYAALRDLPEVQRATIAMRGIAYINDLYGDEPAKRAARRHARFVNSAMMVTLLGAAVSDALEDGRVVSGVGGQYNFVAQAFALDDGRSIITLPATRRKNGKLESNIVWAYGHETIPRHLRDIVVTEYGVADLRGASDEQVVRRLLAIADSRRQDDLLATARKAGKVAPDYRIPDAFRVNRPDRLKAQLSGTDFPAFPLGSDFSAVEQRLLRAMEVLSAARSSLWGLTSLARAGISGEQDREALDRMGLGSPGTIKDRFNRALVAGALRAADRG